MAAHNNQINQYGIAPELVDQMLATIYGQCVGDALGLLTEFMTKEEAKKYYGQKPKNLRYSQKVPDFHRSRWQTGDWTDDTDHMILILQSLLYNKGEISITDFACRIKRWMKRGYPEHGDFGGMGIGLTTLSVLGAEDFTTDPYEVAYTCWNSSQRKNAPNGAVMRTSILGIHQWNDIDAVKRSAKDICKTTHFDPRCQASCVAVSVCIALMLQHTANHKATPITSSQIKSMIKASYDAASEVLETDDEKQELWTYMSCTKLKELQLCEAEKIGYTYKCMGTGFWAVRQDNFKKAMIKVVMEAGDADTNGCVAGSMLACKLGLSSIPEEWISDLKYRDWLLEFFDRFVRLQSELKLPKDQRTSNDDLDLATLDK